MDVEDAIRTRRTLKDFRDEPVPEATLRELLELAVLAPNHHLTEPWRFWVVGRETLERLSEVTGDRKLLRSPTAVVAGVLRTDDAQQADEDYAATACALQNAMLAARGRGLASYWRTPGVFRHPGFAATLGVPDEVRLVGVLHLGWPANGFPDAPPRTAAGRTQWLP